VIDTVPVDYVVNLILAACAGTDPRDTPAVYQIGTSHLNPITLGEVEEIWRTYFREHPMTDDKGRPVLVRPIRFHRDPERFSRGLYLRYQLPLSLAERALTPLSSASGIRSYRRLMRWLVKSRKRIERVRGFSDLYSAYTVNSWIFMNEASRSLFDKLDAEDRARFGFDVQELDWRRFWTDVHIPGMRRFVVEERPTP
jgi:fatty acyl-CoA reductase